jgi:DNA invertase Pin-like site-specific DNA recombinase
MLAKKLSKFEIKEMVVKNVAECKLIARKYIEEWKAANREWPTIEGCVYLRLSTDMQVSVEKGSLEQQIYIAISEAETRSTSEQVNYKIVHFYIEPGITGRHDRRPEFLRLQRDIANKRYKFVIFKEVARIARDSVLWKNFFRACIENGCAVCIRGFPINPNDPSQLFLLDILAAAAEYEANLTSKRIRESVFFAMKTSGKFNSTHPLLGFSQLTVNGDAKVGLFSIDAQEIKIVEWIMEEFCTAESYERVAELCGQRSVLNKKGKPFSANALRYLLTNQRYIGKWEVNRKNQDKDQKKLMPYQRYMMVELPHGPAISLDLWERVQKTVKTIGATRMRDADARRTYPLSLLLKCEDGSTFAGQGAWSGSAAKHCYYWNRKNNIRIAAEVIETEAAKMVRQIIENSKELRQAIEQRTADRAEYLKALNVKIGALRGAVEECDEDTKKLNRRLDFFLGGASEDEANGFKAEYLGKTQDVKAIKMRLRQQLAELERQRDEVARSEFDYKGAEERARKAMNYENVDQAIRLRSAYRALFKMVKVGPQKPDGHREFKWILRQEDAIFDDAGNGKSALRSVEDAFCTSLKVVDVSGVEPLASSLRTTRSTN